MNAEIEMLIETHTLNLFMEKNKHLIGASEQLGHSYLSFLSFDKRLLSLSECALLESNQSEGEL